FYAFLKCFFGVVPRATGVSLEDREQHTRCSHPSEHTTQRLSAHNEAHHNGDNYRHRTRQDHLTDCRLGRDRNALTVLSTTLRRIKNTAVCGAPLFHF